MFNIGSGEMILLFVVALMIFGPHRLPEMGRSFGEAMASFRKAMQSLSEPIMNEVQTQSRQIREAAQIQPTTTASTAALPEAAAVSEPPPAEEASKPAENASTAEALQAAADAADQPQEQPEPEEEHVPVPMSSPEPTA